MERREEAKKAYVKPVVITKKMELGVYGDYDNNDDTNDDEGRKSLDFGNL